MTAKLAPRGTELPPYDAKARCPKCGHDDINTYYAASKCDDPECYNCDLSHLCRTCQRCKYQWAEADIGARPSVDALRASYLQKVQEFAAETSRTSALISALHELGHRASAVHVECPGCRVLAELNVIDPADAAT